MKKQIILIFVIMLLLSTNVFAHQGKTDANGGHYNRATGEYHYHHGYPAHSHDDGCPYDYDDQTDHSSSESQGNHDSTLENDSSSIIPEKDYNIPEYTLPVLKDEYKQEDKNKDKEKTENIRLLILIAIILAVLFVLYIIADIFEKKQINKQNKREFHQQKEHYIPISKKDKATPKPKQLQALKTNQLQDLKPNQSKLIQKYSDSRERTLKYISQFLNDYKTFDIPPTDRVEIDKIIEKGYYKTAVLMLIDLGIYKDYFYDMLDINIFRDDLKEYADYRAFINME